MKCKLCVNVTGMYEIAQSRSFKWLMRCFHTKGAKNMQIHTIIIFNLSIEPHIFGGLCQICLEWYPKFERFINYQSAKGKLKYKGKKCHIRFCLQQIYCLGSGNFVLFITWEAFSCWHYSGYFKDRKFSFPKLWQSINSYSLK